MRVDRSELSRRPATADDVAFLVQLRRETMDEHLRIAGLVLSEEEQRARVLSRFQCAEVVEWRGERVGMLKVVRGTGVWHLLQFQIAPELQGRGIGSALLGELVEEACRAGVRLELDVLKVNRARRLYERLGFVVVGESERDFTLRWARDNGPEG